MLTWALVFLASGLISLALGFDVIAVLFAVLTGAAVAADEIHRDGGA